MDKGNRSRVEEKSVRKDYMQNYDIHQKSDFYSSRIMDGSFE